MWNKRAYQTDPQFEFATLSLQEELEAIAAYQERLLTAENEDLRYILQHNMEEEQEHAAMLQEWIDKRFGLEDIEPEDSEL